MIKINQQNDNVRQIIGIAAREHHGQLLAILIRDLRDFQLAEDCLHDAIESALIHWQRSGPPHSPKAWLLQVARRKALDRIRRAKNFKNKSTQIAMLMDSDQNHECDSEEGAIPDERLRLIFTCCHPALDPHTAVALSLRTLCGLTTSEIARAFVVSEETMSQRLVRARHKVAKAGIAYQVPDAANLLPRLHTVLNTIYLTFNEGYAATSGNQHGRIDLCEEAIRLSRLLIYLCPHQAEASGLLALMLFTHARKSARSTPMAPYISLEDQDRSLWDEGMIDEADKILTNVLGRGAAGLYQLQAAISAVHAQAKSFAETRWHEIVLLYDKLYHLNNNPVFLLNQAVALSYYKGAEQGLALVETLATELSHYQPFYAARADLLRRLDRFSQAAEFYQQAIELSQNSAERQFLELKRQSVLQ